MAAALLTASSDTTDKTAGQTYVTASVSPSANALVVACLHIRWGSGTTALSTPTPTGGGMTSWTVLTDGATTGAFPYDTVDPKGSIFCWVAQEATPGTGAVTFSLVEGAHAAVWSVFEITDANLRQGGNGLAAIVQVQRAGAGTGATSQALSLNALASASNLAVAASGHQAGEATNWAALTTELNDTTVGTPSTCMAVAWDTNKTDCGSSWTTSSAHGTIAFEVNLTTASEKPPHRNVHTQASAVVFEQSRIGYSGGWGR